MEMFDALSSIKDTLIPILWFEEGIDELGDHQSLNHSMLCKLWLFCVYFLFEYDSHAHGNIVEVENVNRSNRATALETRLDSTTPPFITPRHNPTFGSLSHI